MRGSFLLRYPGLILAAGFAVTAIGGPVSLLSLIPQSAGPHMSSIGFIGLSSVFLFAFPLLIWSRYSEYIISPAGEYKFVEYSVGKRLAEVQGAFWAVSYFLYLAYTPFFIVDDQLIPVIPDLSRFTPILVFIIAVIAVLAMIIRRQYLLFIFTAGAALQIVVIAIVAIALLVRTRFPYEIDTSIFIPHAPALSLGSGAVDMSTLFVCLSLVLFLPGTVKMDSSELRKVLFFAYFLIATTVVVASFAYSKVPTYILTSGLPGVDLANFLGGRPLAVVVDFVTVVSTFLLMAAEFLAVVNLLSFVSRMSLGKISLGISLLFLVAVSLGSFDPIRFYETLLKASLIGLLVSQLIVVAVYPNFMAKRLKLTPTGVIVGSVAVVMYGYELYAVIKG